MESEEEQKWRNGTDNSQQDVAAMKVAMYYNICIVVYGVTNIYLMLE